MCSAAKSSCAGLTRLALTVAHRSRTCSAPAPIARTLAGRYGLKEADAARAIAMVERVLSLPIMGQARGATKIFREAPLGDKVSRQSTG
jgi:hypothetical protein